MPGRRWFWILVGIAVALGLAATGIATFYTDILWFQELEYFPVFRRVLTGKLLTGLVGGAFFFLVTYVNLRLVLGRRRQINLVGGLVMPVPVSMPDRARQWALAASAVVGVLGGIAAYTQWHVVLAYFNATPFGINDPFFGKDVGFYIFNLPFLRLIQQHLFVSFLVAGLISVIAYYAFGDLRLALRRVLVNRRTRIHLSVLASILFALKAWGYQISIWDLMYSPRGAAFGASYTDIHAQVPAYRLLIGVALAGAVVSLLGIMVQNLRWVGFAVLGLTVLSVLAGYAYPAFMQQFTVSPNELAYEIPFIEHNIAFTREAFNLDRIETTQFPATENLTMADLKQVPGTVRNFRLWDYRVLRDTYTQVQEIRMYYRFNDVDIGRYMVNGEYRQVLLSPRELDINLLPTDARTWINLHLKYTHGYGVVMSPASDVTGEGMPSFYFMDVPPKTKTDLVLTRPELYFGELTNHYIITNAKEPEFDYPRTDVQAIEPTFYKGQAGITLKSFIRRLAFTLRFRDYQIMVSGALTPESRVIMKRNILERVRSIAPFFMYDSDPYLVIAEGRMYWFLDAYTVSANYPYSQPDPETWINYIRNSVKVTVDAYDGTVTFYRVDDEDPIVNTYSNIFPTLLKDFSQMPEDLRAHIRYPEDLFSIQSRVLLTYHMTDPQMFYNKEDYWEIPREIYANLEKTVEPYYIVLHLPGESAPEYMLMTPFTPRGKPNMTAWLGVRCDPERYGEMVLFQLPKDKLVPGPMQVESMIAQNPGISEAMTLWGQVGSQVIRGNLLTIPIKGSLLYIEPLYIQAEKVKIPELKRVLMYYGGRVVMGTTVEDALSALLGTGEDVPPDFPGGTELPDISALVARANRLLQEANEKLRTGDWAGYGRNMEELARVLADLEKAIAAGTTPSFVVP